ncbi:phosphoribosylformylglycinamidine cyclo-ligase [Thermoplasmatales archaeon ex4572_165]|nr:MAG: phosphoribosylformylglycinamidine cyclo-ligase [Thermoplasmatales archaeon ex4572_165]RLF58638.1 MAG: phosphoribosylformylglycinamidine cyclo-ligase [Thermoplasmata archaeon]
MVLLKTKTYAESGVDIHKEEEAINEIISNFTMKRKGIGKPLGGHYAGMIEFHDHALVLCTDGVGSKVLLASMMKKWDTIGIDCIAMNVNDAICVGAEPLSFVDYLAIDDPNPKITNEIGKGLAKGAELSNISIIGGETASLPEIINGFDLAGTCLAYVDKNKIITGETIEPEDKIIGLSSSGIHSNGYTLARKIIEESTFSFQDPFPDTKKSIGEVLLTPTNIYVKEIVALLKEIKVHGLAHITGGGLRNLLRLKKNVKFVINHPFPPNDIFTFLSKQGEIKPKEMYQTFNMGLGFVIVVKESDVDQTMKILKKHSHADVQLIGQIEKGEGVTLPSENISYP